MMSGIIEDIQRVFEANRNEEVAFWMKKYMKDRFSYLGIKAPLRNAISKDIYQKVKRFSREEIIQLVEALWELPEREYQYLAIEILKKNGKKLIVDDFSFVRKLITTKSWWDTVDSLASNTLGGLLSKYPELIRYMDEWIKDEDMWIRRSAIIFQLKYKEKTNEDQLFGYCLLTCHEKEFFIRKAIGWALRQYAKTEPDNVRQFVLANERDLSSLSVKEALRNITV